MEEKKYIFPEYFSVNAKKLILLNGKPQNRHVYRVAKYGRDTTTAFLNYYDEVVLGLKTVRNKQKYLEVRGLIHFRKAGSVRREV